VVVILFVGPVALAGLVLGEIGRGFMARAGWAARPAGGSGPDGTGRTPGAPAGRAARRPAQRGALEDVEKVLIRREVSGRRGARSRRAGHGGCGSVLSGGLGVTAYQGRAFLYAQKKIRLLHNWKSRHLVHSLINWFRRSTELTPRNLASTSV
jgi:hypothetical protein